MWLSMKNLYDQAFDSDIKRYEGIRKLTTGQDEDYGTVCLLDYEYINNHYRLIAFDLIRQKIDAVPKQIQRTQFDGQLKNVDGKMLMEDNLCFFNTFRKDIRNTFKIFSWNCNSIIKDGKL